MPISTSTTRRLSTALAAAAALGLMLTGCSLDTPDLRFDTYTAAAKSGIRSDIPLLVTHDSTNVRYRSDGGSSTPSTLLRWDSPTSPASTPDYCRTSTLPHAPKLTATWWPRSVPATGLTCGIWASFDDDGHHYAWDTRN